MGLDVSTTTIGICVLSVGKKGKIEIKYLDYYKPLELDKDSPEVLDILSDAKKHILSIADKYKPNHIVIENIIKFMQGKSSANTTIILAIINRVLGLALYEHCKIKPSFLNVNTIRAQLKKEAKLEDRVKKEDVPGALEMILNIKFPYRYDINKKTKKKKIAAESYDMADAMGVSYVYSMSLNAN